MKNQSKVVVIIPAYEPPSSFIDYTKALVNEGFGAVVVVNDGSNEKYDYVFDSISQIDRCTVLSYGENHGKGYALKTAFKHCKENYDDSYVFVTADCDGQHLLKDVMNVAATAWEHQNELILGSRDFSLEHVPARSRAGNVNIRRMFKFFYGLSLSDTQTGLRACSYSLLHKLIDVKGDRFDRNLKYRVMRFMKDYKHIHLILKAVALDVYKLV